MYFFNNTASNFTTEHGANQWRHLTSEDIDDLFLLCNFSKSSTNGSSYIKHPMYNPLETSLWQWRTGGDVSFLDFWSIPWSARLANYNQVGSGLNLLCCCCSQWMRSSTTVSNLCQPHYYWVSLKITAQTVENWMSISWLWSQGTWEGFLLACRNYLYYCGFSLNDPCQVHGLKLRNGRSSTVRTRKPFRLKGRY